MKDTCPLNVSPASVGKSASDVADMLAFEDPEDTMARRMLYRIYPLVMASALGYLIGLFAIRGL